MPQIKINFEGPDAEEANVEVWKNIREYEDHYQVSNLGRVKRIKKGRGTSIGKILRQINCSVRYPYVGLTSGNKQKTFRVHRLVAETFLGLPQKGQEVNHKDGNPQNNIIENLEWVTRSENAQHKCKILGKGVGEKNYHAKLKNIDIPIIRKMLKKGISQRKIANLFGVSQRAINFINTNQTWKGII